MANTPAPATAVTVTATGRLICLTLLKETKLVAVSLDLKTGRENCGIIQMSAEILRHELSQVQGKAAKDTLSDVSLGTAVYRD